MLTKKSTWIGTAIVGFWLIAMAVLLQRELLPRVLMSPPAARAIEDLDRWYGVYVGDGARAGAIHVVTGPKTRDGVGGMEMTVAGRLSLNLLDVATELYGDAAVWMPFERDRVEFSGQLTSGEHRFGASGSIHDGMLRANVDTGNESFPVQWPVGEVGAGTALFSTGTMTMPIAPGDTVYMSAFDPMTMRAGEASVTCLRREALRIGDEEIPTSVCETTLGGITSRMWLDDIGDVVQAETPYGFMLRRLTPEEAAVPVDPSRAQDVLAIAAVVPTGATPFRGARRMAVTLQGLDPQLHIPTDTRQHVDDNGRVIITTPPAPPVDVEIEYSTDVVDTLASDPLIPANHPTVVDQAARIVGSVEGVWPRALRLHSWVYDEIAKVPVPAIPSALDVLETREGDCNEHTVLFAALARSQGIPTRVAVGVVWSDDLGAFYYHAWPEVLAGEWVPMDPTLGQPIADATHIKLIEGDIDRWPRLIAFLGRMRIEVLEVEP